MRLCVRACVCPRAHQFAAVSHSDEYGSKFLLICPMMSYSVRSRPNRPSRELNRRDFSVAA